MTYVTDGIRLFEVLGEQVQKNAGLLGGYLRALMVRDCATEDEFVLTGDDVIRLESIPADPLEEPTEERKAA